LKVAHDQASYLYVVVLAPQFTVQIIDILSSYNEGWIEREVTSKLSDEEKEAYQLAGQLQKKGSDRSYIVGDLGDSGH
jgi:hypothetical protein